MLRVRHVAVCTADPWGTEARVMDILKLAVVQRDKFNPSIRIRNGVFALQSTFLEITTPAGSTAPTQRFLDKHGDGGYMVCLQVDDLEQARARAEAMGIRVVLSIDRHRCGEQTVSAAHLHPADTGGTLFSFEEAHPPESWAYAGEAWQDYRRADVVLDIVGVELASPDPAGLARRLGRLLDVPMADGVLSLNGCRIIIRAAAEGSHRDRLHAIEFMAADRSRAGEEHLVAGTVFRFV